jgi:hypothetical protein
VTIYAVFQTGTPRRIHARQSIENDGSPVRKNEATCQLRRATEKHNYRLHENSSDRNHRDRNFTSGKMATRMALIEQSITEYPEHLH